MARLNVNPTRMELTSLKKQLRVAVRGHKLLKDKRDELMKRFLELVRFNKTLREEVELLLKDVYDNFTIASAVLSDQVLQAALMFPKQGVDLQVSNKNVMSVAVPVFNFKPYSDDASDIYPYGFATTSGELDTAISKVSDVFPKLLELAAVEKECQLIADEIEKTRRRVNALEHVMIPRYIETIRYIKMKLDENERGNITRLMKVKDMMLEQARQNEIRLDEEAFQQVH
ncbi:V-type sodium ATPase subunit D [bioreactor metagenome]|uniref:V-type sodium ATPase subunit D n=1 Tax=bioreactor metagenome TaxID=1076179 RepID=A0A645CKZ4_9ZZZZ